MKSFYDWSVEQKLNEIAINPDLAVPSVAKPKPSLRLGAKMAPDNAGKNIIPVVVHPKVLKWFGTLHSNSKVLADVFERLKEGDVGGMLLAHLSNEEIDVLKSFVSDVKNNPETDLSSRNIADHISRSIENGLRVASKNFAHHEKDEM